MDLAKGSAFEPMLTTAALVAREDFRLGTAVISPSTRTISGPGGKSDVEPRVMQVLVVLADAASHVVTRDTLFSRCWGGAYVGDDSLNRAIGMVRKLADEIAAGSFEVETVPRTGYKLIVKSGAHPRLAGEAGPAKSTRRLVLAGGLAAIAGTAGIGAWWLGRDKADPRVAALMERGEGALRLDEPAAKYFEQAVSIEPRNAKAWGLLAFTLGSGGDMGPLGVTGTTAQAAERAARTALEIDPNEPNALIAMIFIHRGRIDGISREQRFRQVLAIDPNSTRAMQGLGQTLHSVGRCREALALAERATAIEPLAPDFERRKAMGLWIVGRIPEADRVIDRAIQLWPSHRLVRMARLMIYAFTGRAQAALALVEQEEANPRLLTPETASVWRSSLEALEQRTASNVAAARAAVVDGAKTTRATAAYGILVLSELGELDAAFDVANGFLLGRGSVVVRTRPDSKRPTANSSGWRNSFGLFTPPTKAMRLDPRFRSLADGLGLSDYWRRRGIGPDAFLFKP